MRYASATKRERESEWEIAIGGDRLRSTTTTTRHNFFSLVFFLGPDCLLTLERRTSNWSPRRADSHKQSSTRSGDKTTTLEAAEERSRMTERAAPPLSPAPALTRACPLSVHFPLAPSANPRHWSQHKSVWREGAVEGEQEKEDDNDESLIETWKATATTASGWVLPSTPILQLILNKPANCDSKLARPAFDLHNASDR